MGDATSLWFAVAILWAGPRDGEQRHVECDTTVIPVDDDASGRYEYWFTLSDGARAYRWREASR